jgi:hypothetical protein
MFAHTFIPKLLNMNDSKTPKSRKRSCINIFNEFVGLENIQSNKTNWLNSTYQTNKLLNPIESNLFRTNSIYFSYMTQAILNAFNYVIANKITLKNISLSYVVNFLNYQYGFKPTEITNKTGNKHLKEIENMSVVEYVEKNVIKNNEWKLDYDYTRNELCILESATYEAIHINLFNATKTTTESLMIASISNNSFHDYTNFYSHRNNYVEYPIKKNSGYYALLWTNNYFGVILGTTDFVAFIDNNICVDKKSHGFDLIKIFEEEFNMIVPIELYLDTEKTDTYYKLSDKFNKDYIIYSLETNIFEISKHALNEFFFKSFENIFGININIKNYENLIKPKVFIKYDESREQDLLNKIKTKIFSYFIDKTELNITKVFVCNNDIELIEYEVIPEIDTYLDSVIINDNLLQCKPSEIMNIFDKTIDTVTKRYNKTHTFTKLNDYCLTVKTPKFTIMAQLGPVEIYSHFYDNMEQGHITMTDIQINEITLDIHFSSGKEYIVSVGNSEHFTENRELIVWKGVNVNGFKGIAKLLIPKNGKICPDSNDLKFRTNKCFVEGIYKFKKLYKCISCSKNFGMYKYKNYLYCNICTKSLLKTHNITFEKINVLGEEVDIAYSLKQSSFQYVSKRHIKISNFKTSKSSCDRPGIYFFFTIESVMKYCGITGSLTQESLDKIIDKQIQDIPEEDEKHYEEHPAAAVEMIPLKSSEQQKKSDEYYKKFDEYEDISIDKKTNKSVPKERDVCYGTKSKCDIS